MEQLHEKFWLSEDPPYTRITSPLRSLSGYSLAWPVRAKLFHFTPPDCLADQRTGSGQRHREHGADINGLDQNNHSPLVLAIRHANVTAH